MRRLLPTLLLLLGSIRPASAAVDLSRVDLTPYLRVVATEVVTSIVAPGRTLTIDEDLFVSRAGGVILVQPSFADGYGYQTGLLRRVSLKDDLDTLKQALARNRVGFQVDCESKEGYPGRRDIYWYGREGRRNVFSIKVSIFESPPDPVLPQCSAEAIAIFQAVTNFYSEVLGIRDAEVIIYPPPPGPPR